jgi:glycosyltransferase involved in cell wall biosynthesis
MAKILFISSMDWLPWGGSEELCAQTALELRDAGHDVVFCRKGWTPTPIQVTCLLEHGCRFIFREQLKSDLLSRISRKIQRTLHGCILQNPSWSRISDEKPDLICITEGSVAEGIEWSSLCQGANIPYVTVSHGNSEKWWPEDKQAAQLIDAYSGAVACFFVSDRNKELFEDQVGFRFPNAHIVRNPYKSSAVTIDWPSEEEFAIALVSRFEPKVKGQDLAIKVFGLPKWRERPLRLRLYGDEHGFGESLRRLVQIHGALKIDFMGHVNDPTQIWQANHALLIASRNEGLPIVLVEAMQAARMAVVTDVAGNTELVEEGVTGFVAKAPTVELIDDALEKAWQNRHHWREMGLKAEAKVIQKMPSNPGKVFSERLLALVGGSA